MLTLEIFQRWLLLPLCGIIYFIIEYKNPLNKEQQKTFFRDQSFHDVFWFYLTDQIAPIVSNIIKFLFSFLIWRHFNQNSDNLINLHPLIAVTLCFIWLDFSTFVYHYCAHRFDFLWRFHRLHHSSKTLDWLSGFRSFWAEDLMLEFCTSLCFIWIALPPEWFFGLAVFRAHSNFFIHTNSKIHLGFLRGWIVSADTHHWHHSLEKKFKYGHNFGSFTFVWDRLMGTLYLSEKINGPKAYGLKGEYNPNGLYMRLFEPFVSEKKYLAVKAKFLNYLRPEQK